MKSTSFAPWKTVRFIITARGTPMQNIVKLTLPEKCRIIAVSDIHTCWYLLDSVLKKAEYRPGEDYLVIVGDILEHWDQNLQTIEYVMNLCRNERVYCLMGNNDTMSFRMAKVYDYEKFIERCRRKPCNTFLQMAEKLGITEFPEEQFEELWKKISVHFKAELDFIENLPYALETQQHIFVHAGIENRPDWENTSDLYALTQPYYLRENQCSGKWVVVGHYPCYNYKRAKNTNLPIIDESKRMICIDGGLTIKHACQLNALCINKDGDNYTNEIIWDTFFDKKKVTKDFSSHLSPVYIDPYNNRIELLETDNGIARVRDTVTGKEGFIPEEKLYKEDYGLRIWNNLNAFPTVIKGETVHFCGFAGNYANVITENGQVGWIPKDIIE